MKPTSWQPDGTYVFELSENNLIIGRVQIDAGGKRGVFARLDKDLWPYVSNLIEMTEVVPFWEIKHLIHKNIKKALFETPGKIVVVMSGCVDTNSRDVATEHELFYTENISTIGTALLASASTLATLYTINPDLQKVLNGTAKKIFDYTHLLAVAFGTDLNHPWFCKPAYFDDVMLNTNILEIIAAQATVYSRIAKIELEVVEQNDALYVSNIRIAGFKVTQISKSLKQTTQYRGLPGIIPYNLGWNQQTNLQQIKKILWYNPKARFAQRIFIDTQNRLVFEYAPKNNLKQSKKVLYKTHPLEIVFFPSNWELYGTDDLTEAYLSTTRRSLPMSHYLPGGGYYQPPPIVFTKSSIDTFQPILIDYKPDIDKKFDKHGVTIDNITKCDSINFTNDTLKAIRWRNKSDPEFAEKYSQILKDLSNNRSDEFDVVL